MGLAQRARQRYAERDAAERQREAEVAEYHRTHLDRERAAAFLGISTHRLKRLMSAGTGSASVKRGNTKQAVVRWRVGELQAWAANPTGYIAARATNG